MNRARASELKEALAKAAQVLRKASMQEKTASAERVRYVIDLGAFRKGVRRG